jgi:hypothetical protein
MKLMNQEKMMKQKFVISLCLCLSLFVLAACQPQGVTTKMSTETPTQEATLTSLPTSTSIPLPTDTPAPTVTPATADAIQTVNQYFAALQKGDDQAAAGFVSIRSLSIDNMTLSNEVDDLHTQMANGTQWSDLQVKDSQLFDPSTVLVTVSYKLTSKDPKSGKTSTADMNEVWPVIFENGAWMVNRNNLIDFKTLSVAAQTVNGMTVAPLKMARYSDRIRLTMLVQNANLDSVAWGLPTEDLAVFVFGDKQVTGVQKQMYFEHLQSQTDAFVDVMGLFTSYPDQVILRRFKNSTVAPWFTFNFVW